MAVRSSAVGPRLERKQTHTKARATRIVVSAFGGLAALVGIEHGVGEILQGSVAPSSVVIESWPDTIGFEILGGEPAMTLIPNLAVTGVLAVIVSVVLGVWTIWFVDRPHGGMVLIGLSVLLLLVGGGFGPPLIGIIAGVGATRMGRTGGKRPGRVLTVLAPVWPWLLAVGLAGYLSLVPGMVLASQWLGFNDPLVVLGLTIVSFTALILALLAARAHDRLA